MNHQQSPRLLRRRQVEDRTGLSRSTIYQLMSMGDFPAQIKLGPGTSVAWVENEIEQWIRDRITEARTGSEVRAGQAA